MKTKRSETIKFITTTTLLAALYAIFTTKKKPNIYRLVDATQHIDFKW